MLTIEAGGDGVVVLKGRLDAAQAANAQGFLDGVGHGHAGRCRPRVHLQCRARRPAQDPEASVGQRWQAPACRGESGTFGTSSCTRASISCSRSSRPGRPRRQLFGRPGVIVIDGTDHALLERFRRGDTAAFRALVVRYQRPVYNAAFGVLRNADDARDVAQTVFMRVAERSGDYDPGHKFFSWIYRIAVNEALDSLRRNGREEGLDEDAEIPDAVAGPERRFEDDERARLLHKALKKMSVADRTVITLRHFSELPYEEIAEATGVDARRPSSPGCSKRGSACARCCRSFSDGPYRVVATDARSMARRRARSAPRWTGCWRRTRRRVRSSRSSSACSVRWTACRASSRRMDSPTT